MKSSGKIEARRHSVHSAWEWQNWLFAMFSLMFASCATQGPSENPASPIRYSPEADLVDPAIRYVESQSKHNYHEGWFDDGATNLHFVEAGEGPLILLYHGFPSYWLSWHEQIEDLASDYRVIAVDGLGAGLSSKPQDPSLYRVEALAKQIERLTQALSPNDPFVLIGHDWGAPLAFAYAQAYPERLHGVIGLSAPPYNTLLTLLSTSPEQQAISNYMQTFRTLSLDQIRDEGIGQAVAQQSYAKLGEDKELDAREMELFHTSVGRAEAVHGGMSWYSANIPTWDSIGPDDHWPSETARLTLPSLFIWGEADTIFLPSTIDAVLDMEPSLQIARLPNVGHWTPMDKPHLSTAAIRDFLDTLEALK